jgi:hypothetical protein
MKKTRVLFIDGPRDFSSINFESAHRTYSEESNTSIASK